MQILISSHKIVGGIDAIFCNNISDALGKKVLKYFKDIKAAKINFVKRHGVFKTCIVINEGIRHHLILKANANSHNINKSFKLALKKMVVQLSKYKQKIKVK